MGVLPGNFADGEVCILGLGYVGLTLATVMADAGFRVHGVEINDATFAKLSVGEPHFFETGLTAVYRRVFDSGRLTVTRRIPDDCPATVYIITVGTPLGADGRARLDMVEGISGEIAARGRAGSLVALRSTVKIGTTRGVVAPVLAASGKDFDLAFCPERTVQGQALKELRELPQIVGGMTLEAGLRAATLFQFLTPTVTRVSGPEAAEVCKLVDNVSRDVMFAYANEVAKVCDAVGVSAVEVIRAGKLGYPRTNLPLPGPVSGPCLTKDPHILRQSLEGLGVDLPITRWARQSNEALVGETVTRLKAKTAGTPGFPAAPTVAVMGLAFKGRPVTDDLRGSSVYDLLAALRAAWPEGRLRGYDALVPEENIRGLGIEPVADMRAACAGADLVIVHNNHPVFADMPIEELTAAMNRPGVFYDFWNHFDPEAVNTAEGTVYLTLGAAEKKRPA
jgi:UDP-N-acetyl-D-mannosaminuronic acid dehydrogenase